MNKTILTLKTLPDRPARRPKMLGPDVLAPLKHAEVRALPVLLGKPPVPRG